MFSCNQRHHNYGQAYLGLPDFFGERRSVFLVDLFFLNLKRAVSRDVQTLIFVADKYTLPGPLTCKQTAIILRFFSLSRTYSTAKSEKCVQYPRSQRLRGHGVWTLGNPQVLNMKNVAVGYVNVSTNVISTDCSFEMNERPSKYAVEVRIVKVLSV